jgi:hypothetical protein
MVVDKTLLGFRLDGFGKTRKVVLVVIVIIRILATLLFLSASSLLDFCFLFLGETCLDLVGSFLLLGGLGSLIWFIFFVEFTYQVLDCSFVEIGQFLFAF